MSTATQPTPMPPGPAKPRKNRAKSLAMQSMLSSGEPMVWLTGGALMTCVIMIVGILGLIIYSGMSTFWPLEIATYQLEDGRAYTGEVTRSETYPFSKSIYTPLPPIYKDKLRPIMSDDAAIPEGYFIPEKHWHITEKQLIDVPEDLAAALAPVIEPHDDPKFPMQLSPAAFAGLAPEAQQAIREQIVDPQDASRVNEGFIRDGRAVVDANIDDFKTIPMYRRLLRTGNFRVTGSRFQWISDYELADNPRSTPDWALVSERVEWGRFYGFPEGFSYITLLPEANDEGRPLNRQEQETWINAQLAGMKPQHGGRLGVVAVMNRQVGSPGVLRNIELTQIIEPGEMSAAMRLIGVAEVIEGDQAAWKHFQDQHPGVRQRYNKKRSLMKHDIGEINFAGEAVRLQLKEAQLEVSDLIAAREDDTPAYERAMQRLAEAEEVHREKEAWVEAEYQKINAQIRELDRANAGFAMQFRLTENGNLRYQMSGDSGGEGRPIYLLQPLDLIVRMYPANQMGFLDKVGIYLSRWREFLLDDPREANMEGGVYPAIFGTVLMTLLMALVVVPFGVLAALYLREYAKAGFIVSIVRIAVNNLAGVPSIVFGVFGLGFFCYIVGSYIDGGSKAIDARVPASEWFVYMGLLAALATLGAVCTFMSISKPGKPTSTGKRILQYVAVAVWILSALVFVALVATTPFFDGFYRARLPTPTFGKGALIWASATLALLTLPVVIVATEEALSAVPNTMREGSYACGASKWQTIKRIVLPRAMPGIMTGMILAMARGAGEVAPLMIVGAVKLAPELPFSWRPSEAFGLNRSFMHLGFHIYDVGFQSPDSEAARPMVYTTTLLLILIVAVLNLSAIWLRKRLRRRFVANQF